MKTTSLFSRAFIRQFAQCSAFLAAAMASHLHAAQMSDYAVSPSTLASGVPPMVMLALSNDHQLYFKAYTDYDDLNGNGVVDAAETSYDHKHVYAGYFEADYCYNSVGGVFNPAVKADNDGYCDGTSQYWSGNFLNWATMTRIDVLRKMLYGGKRSTQSDTETILERSYLPNDAHSFAKYYNGSDLRKLTPYSSNTAAGKTNEGLTLCNTTFHDINNKFSVNNANPPIMRAIQGNYELWAASERYQCLIRTPKDTYLSADNNEVPTGSPTGDLKGWTPYGVAIFTSGVQADLDKKLSQLGSFGFYPHPYAPSEQDKTDKKITDFVVRVKACATADSPNCKTYTDGTKSYVRPIGLLHKFGEDDSIKWGLMSGSYSKNKSGGFLRKAVGNFSNEVEAKTGQFKTGVEGIVSNIDAFRIAGWAWGVKDGTDLAYDKVGVNCPRVLANFDNGKCIDWGNPLGEIMLESYRYFAGAQAPLFVNDGAQNETALAPKGVTVAPWTSPLTSENACSNLNVIGINTSAQTFDNDQTALNDLGGTLDTELAEINSDKLLGIINTERAQKGGTKLASLPQFLVGNVQADTSNNLCTAKTITSLVGITGVCPESARLQGSWDVVGAAKFAHEHDINTAIKGSQKVNTYGVSLSTALPNITIAVPGDANKKITIVPACLNYELDPQKPTSCALVNFKVLTSTANTGSFYVNWEDSEQGGDYDQDMHGILSYTVTGQDIKIGGEIIGSSTTSPMAFGFVITGVKEPGFKAVASINESYKDFLAKFPSEAAKKAFSLSNCGRDVASCQLRFEVDTNASSVDFLPPPLFFASKVGNDRPGTSYFNNNDPVQLEKDLARVISDLGTRPAKGGSEVSTTKTNAGANLFLHTWYYAQAEELDAAGVKTSVNWLGQVGALFIDENNNLREDSNGDKALDADDLIIEFSDTEKDSLGQPYVKTSKLATKVGDKPTLVKANGTFKDIKYLWTTTESLKAADVTKRKLMTVIPSTVKATTPTLGNLVTGDLVEFNKVLFATGKNASLLGGYANTDKLVDFIRGNEVPGLRSRTLNKTKYLLGDITGTSPIVVSTPDYSYDTELGDGDYTAYKTNKAKEPMVVYTASNNGLIQAFNAGTYNKAKKEYSGTTELPLGKELWGYIPFNLLPHLQWLADPAYQHVPYFNGFMRTYDVKAFKSSANANGHTKGWGTILVVGTGQGGANLPIKMDATANKPDFYTRPAYIVLDISDRTAAPKLIAEISHDELGFTTAEPDVVRYESSDKSGWFLVFGSGPRGSNDAARRASQLNFSAAIDANPQQLDAQQPRIFALDLAKTELQTPAVIAVGEDNAFVGGINAMDWNRDFLDDAIYFGTVAGTIAEPSGSLIRGRLTFDAGKLTFDFSTVMNTQMPVTARPTTVLDYAGDKWIFAGTGRFYTRKDANTLPSANLFVGIVEAENDVHPSGVGTTTFKTTDLYNSTAVVTYQGGAISGASPTEAKLKTVDELRSYIHNTATLHGWYRTFTNANGIDERQHSEAAYAASTLLFGTSDPGEYGSCNAGDKGYIYLIDMLSGVPSPYSSYTEKVVDPLNAGVMLDRVVPGLPINSAVFQKLDPFSEKISLDNAGVADTPKLDLNIDSKRQSWREVPITW